MRNYAKGQHRISAAKSSKDIQQGIRLLEMASSGGIMPQADHALGIIYLYGDQIPRNYALAYKYLVRSVKAGFVKSLMPLAEVYLSGFPGYNGDGQAAVDLLVIAGKNGITEAYVYVAELKYYGIRVAGDWEDAHLYMKIAAEHGNPKAKALLDMIENPKKYVSVQVIPPVKGNRPTTKTFYGLGAPALPPSIGFDETVQASHEEKDGNAHFIV